MIKYTLADLISLATDVEDYNTNNDWGFGGGVGKIYTLPNGVVLKVGMACYRHHKSHKYYRVWYKGDEIMDVNKLSYKQLDHIMKIQGEVLS